MNRRLGIATIAVLVGLAILGLAAQLPRIPVTPAPETPPVSTADPEALRAEFLPLLQQALATADMLVAMGDARERNLLVIHARQSAMLEALAAVDTWLDANPDAAGMPAAIVYRDGAREIRAAMDEARDGLLHLDFGEVAHATTTMRQGVAALRQALMMLSEAPASVATPSSSGPPHPSTARAAPA